MFGNDYYFQYAVTHYEEEIARKVEQKRLLAQAAARRTSLAARMGDTMIRLGSRLKEHYGSMTEVRPAPKLNPEC
jgi:hypothetical protein